MMIACTCCWSDQELTGAKAKNVLSHGTKSLEGEFEAHFEEEEDDA